MKHRISVIMPAAGASLRFLKDAPSQSSDSKLFAKLRGRSLVTYALQVFQELPCVSEVILAVSSPAETRFRKEVVSQWRGKVPVRLVVGGDTRAESVQNALKRVSKNVRYVCIHDAARPLLKPDWINEMLKRLGGADGIVLGRRAVPTIKSFEPKTGMISKTLNRSELFEAETPQILKKELLLKAYRVLGKEAFRATDDASLIEKIGGRVKTFLHSDINLKVTTYQDLNLARCAMGESDEIRIGSGWDLHRLVEGRPFYLGGVHLKTRFGPSGHSDADPLLHAVTDAILGAIGAGDIGDLFSDKDPKWKNRRSSYFVAEALSIARRKGFQPTQADATVVLEKPKLGVYKLKIRQNLAKLLSLDLDRVGLKAKTAEGLGAEGRGEAVSAQALIVMKKVD